MDRYGPIYQVTNVQKVAENQKEESKEGKAQSRSGPPPYAVGERRTERRLPQPLAAVKLKYFAACVRSMQNGNYDRSD